MLFGGETVCKLPLAEQEEVVSADSPGCRNIADKLQPRNINVSFTNNSNVAIDVIIFTFYSDQLKIDVETGIVTK